ncbi:MAG TPA: DEAD/DEAH box helicase [Kiritimatiellia bacterium]|nr:DEAD/DEAH box helicase [Kiritimatiellia bacterium]
MKNQLQPIPIVDRVIEEYRSYLLTEFRARDEKLREALREAVERPQFLAQESFFQAHRPFKPGGPWKSLGLDAKLAEQMEARSQSKTAFLHQDVSIRHLLAREATPLVVTTGTGSGKTECFLLPVLQNAIEDAAAFKNDGLTAILVYPMNALANDQEERIDQLLQSSGHTHIRFKRYDRTTSEKERNEMRANPPHILLTNYMMLEYLLVRPADREGLFANHRCRFVVLDEVHSYRGSLGSNIALLFRRLAAHLGKARQDWNAEDRSNARRFPSLIPVGTSATIKSVDESGKAPEDVRRLRDGAVREFFSRLTGVEADSIRVEGETIQDLPIPPDAAWPATPAHVDEFDWSNDAAIGKAAAQLAGLPPDTQLDVSVRKARVLWFLNEILARKPLSASEIVDEVRRRVPERAGAEDEAIRREILSALHVGAATPHEFPGALRLRVHRFARGGWMFYRCIDPACGKLYARGELQCSCGKATAPLYMCRSCGAESLRFVCDAKPDDAPLLPSDDKERDEWMMYDLARVESEEDDEEGGEKKAGKQMKGRMVATGSFDPATRCFSSSPDLYPCKVALAPARTRCLVCGSSGGSRNVVTPVSLGTSAAVRVLSESLIEGLEQQNKKKAGYDGKDRLLVFADSRQDAAHQARFITYAGRYDRMRRRLVQALEEHGPLRLDEAVRQLLVRGVKEKDNVHAIKYSNPSYLPSGIQAKAAAWEEAPLLDDLAITSGYRASIINLGLVGVRYNPLDRFIQDHGAALATRLGISLAHLSYVARWLLDEMRTRSALSRPLIGIHPANPGCPDEFKTADWERRIKTPTGYGCGKDERAASWLDPSEIQEGIKLRNFWRKSGGGKSPRTQTRLTNLLRRLGGVEATSDDLCALANFLLPGDGPGIIIPVDVGGFRRSSTLLQVNAESVTLEIVEPGARFRCSICNFTMPWVTEDLPCPACSGTLKPWPTSEIDGNRYVQRIRKRDHRPLHAGEHTAQITGEDRIELEKDFKAPASESPTNVLACSPTLEMGIDVGQLDAVVLRNVPPRPDNYAQRGGRAGRRNRVGIVIGYTRRTPHDEYFYDKPREMIAGEVPAPLFSLSNRDIAVRHLSAIALGASVPGLAGRMCKYVNLQGDVDTTEVDALLAGFSEQFDHAAELVMQAWGREILEPLGLFSKEALIAALQEQAARVRDLFERVSFQIKQLQSQIDTWNKMGRGDRAAVNAMDLKRRLLGLPSDRKRGAEKEEADDRSAGNPMRRFAEFGVLPGYEFPSEPATIHLLGDPHEEETIAVTRRFGLGQYQPDAPVHARGHRWRVVGLDQSSPWNPKTDEPTWNYTLCSGCGLRFDTQKHVKCPRCVKADDCARPLPGYEFGGFLAVRDDTPVLEEEDRRPAASLVQCHPQWDGRVVSRYNLSTGWRIQVRTEEEVRWVNESYPPSAADIKKGIPTLHGGSRGFYLCPSCGRLLTPPEPKPEAGKGRKKAKRADSADDTGHAPSCPRAAQPPFPLAIVAKNAATTLRILVDLPVMIDEAEFKRWGYSMGYALRNGIRLLYMLDGTEVEFELEGPWEVTDAAGKRKVGCLTFVDAAVGGSGFIDRAARELDVVAKRTLEYLDHKDCESSCYRCLKTYQNQRHHDFLFWPGIIDHLEALARESPVPTPAERGDDNDPKPWLEAYAAGVGSPLELAFLRLFERHGIEVEKQVDVSPDEGGRPISCADFVLKGKRVAIYIDGAAFHTGRRLRRDRLIRQRLREGSTPWRVLEFRRSDIASETKTLSLVQADT